MNRYLLFEDNEDGTMTIHVKLLADEEEITSLMPMSFDEYMKAAIMVVSVNPEVMKLADEIADGLILIPNQAPEE